MLNWTPIRNGIKAETGSRTYYISKCFDNIDVSFMDTDAEPVIQRGRKTFTLTNVQHGGIADMDAAKAIAETHAMFAVGDIVTGPMGTTGEVTDINFRAPLNGHGWVEVIFDDGEIEMFTADQLTPIAN